MSSEHTQDEPRQRRSRRTPLILAAATLAVLAVGGGGAYWATTASSGGDNKPGADGAPPPLALDSAPGAPGAPSGGSGGSGGGNGIAPGEPDPNGVVYRASVKLPEGPGKAAVHQPRGTVDEAAVNRLARALGIDGAARLEGDSWKAGATKDGSGPTLTVTQKAPGTWTFARYGSGGTDNCPKGKMCPMHTTGADTGTGTGTGTGGGGPIGEQAAKAAAAPVLKALGQDDAKLDASEILASARVVNADPVIDGLPTYGWTTGIQVGPDGQVVGGSGQLKTPDKGDTYPVLSADKTLAQLNSHREQPKTKDCTGPVPLDGQPTKGRLPSDPQGNIQPCKQPTPSTVTISGATFGLAAQFVAGTPALVPSWLFQVKPDAGQPFTITAPALAPEYIAKPPSGAPVPAPSGSATAPGAHGQSLESYAPAPDGRTLNVTFWGGVCSTYTATADESGDGVRVRVTGQVTDPKKMCVALAKQQTVSVELHQALGARKVLDADTGKELPKK